MTDEKLKIRLEKTKLFNDNIKHVNTLSTGSIIILTAFVDKLFSSPVHIWLVILSLISFLISIIFGVYFSSLNIRLMDQDKLSGFEEFWVGFSSFVFWIAFLLGIASLAIFSIINLIVQ